MINFFLDLMPRVYSTYVFFCSEKRCDSWNPSGSVPYILYRKWGLLIPSNLGPQPRFEFFPKSGKDPKATSCDATDATPGWVHKLIPWRESRKSKQKTGEFSNKKCLGESGARGIWKLFFPIPTCFDSIFLDSMSNPKTPRTFRQEIGVSRLTWKLSKHFSLVMFAQCRVA